MRLIQKSTAEFIGTFFVIFSGCGIVMISHRLGSPAPGWMTPIVFGLAVSTMIYAVGHISGAHFNPAVTLAFSLARHFPKKEVPWYWLAQSLGALCAMFLLQATLPEGSEYALTMPQISQLATFLWEFVLTFFLMFVIIAVATDTRAEGTMAGVAIGATVTIGASVGGPLTGASMNPVRSLAPAVLSGEFNSLWIYLLAPCLGSTAAAFVYQWIRCDPEKSTTKGCC